MFSTKSVNLVSSELTETQEKIKTDNKETQQSQQWLSNKKKIKSNQLHPFTVHQLFCPISTLKEKQLVQNRKENLDQTLQNESEVDNERKSKEKNQNTFLQKLKKYIANSFNSASYLITSKYNQVDQTSFNCDATINDTSLNSLTKYNERQVLIANKRKQKQKTIFDIQDEQS